MVQSFSSEAIIVKGVKYNITSEEKIAELRLMEELIKELRRLVNRLK